MNASNTSQLINLLQKPAPPLPVGPTYQTSFDEEEDQLSELNEDNLFLHEDPKRHCLTLDTSSNSREVNVFELSIDPLSQFTAVLASASAATKYPTNSYGFADAHTNIKLNAKKHSNNEESSYISSLSSSSSITSPSSCSVSSSPLNLKLRKKSSSNPSQLTKSTNTSNSSKAMRLNHYSSGNKPRNLSSNSNGENCSAQELPLIGCELKPNHYKSTRMQDNFGYSLLAGYCDEFVFEFVLHGTSDRTFLNDLHERLVFSKQVNKQ